MHIQRYSSAAMMNFHRNLLAVAATARNSNPEMANGLLRSKKPTCDVFINHRGIDTKRTIATLLYDHFSRLNLQPFLDNKNMKPGDKLFDNIDNAIKNCKVGITVFSPNYCRSYFCLHELALFLESKKKIIPIFCDIKPSQLRVEESWTAPEKDLKRFSLALEEAKHTVGLTFDSSKGNLSDVVNNVSEIVLESLIELESKKKMIESFKNTPKSPITL